ncbi:unnamed protein product [Arctogadus glacialis]
MRWWMLTKGETVYGPPVRALAQRPALPTPHQNPISPLIGGQHRAGLKHASGEGDEGVLRCTPLHVTVTRAHTRRAGFDTTL